MRARTAVVKPLRADGVAEIFDRAVKRHLAWVIGTGHAYVDLENRAHSHGYSFSEFVTEDEETPNLWVAFRSGLVEEGTLIEEANSVQFDSTAEGLGTIRIGSGLDSQLNDDKALVIEVAADGTPSAFINEDNRFTSTVQDMVDARDNYIYTEYVYTIKPVQE